jgi:hypothetical protein
VVLHAMVRTAPGNRIWTTPPNAHWQVLPITSAGAPPMVVVGEPGTQGVRAGTQGIGVSTPRAAAVAAATVGLARLLHMPKVGMLTGVEHVTFAAGVASTMTLEVGSTLRLAGARPKLHCTNAPICTTGWATLALPRVVQRCDAFTDEVSCCPVVVMTQTTVRSFVSQLRAEGRR